MAKAKKKTVAPKLESVPAQQEPQKPSITVESGIPIPIIKVSGQWDFMNEMKSGDSFFLPAKDYNIKSATGTIRSAAKRYGYKVTMRNLTENGEVGARVWRV